ncbi:MAG: glycosyltransferase [Bacteroidota bacterium]
MGRINRGFESYIDDLATKLSIEQVNFSTIVLLGKKIKKASYKNHSILNIPRNFSLLNWMSLSSTARFNIEQFTFFIGLLPYLLLKKPKIVYLGEYNLYCFLFKIRKALNLNFSLVLYTGGQAAPGLFDNKKDYVHHVTDVYCQMLLDQGVPANRQFILPHFVSFDFAINNELVNDIKSKANGKKIILSVGQIDCSIKQMHLIPKLFEGLAGTVFPIIIGATTNETEKVIKYFNEVFQPDGYLMKQSNRNELGNYYEAADLFILCSKKESFGFAFVEALLFNLPIFCNDFPEVHYVLKQQATYLNLDDLENAQVALNKSLDSFQSVSNENGEKFVRLNYSWESLKPQYLNMFNTFISN